MGTELSEIPREKAGRDAVMKVFVVLAIAVLSGCHANLFYADEPKPQLEVLTDAFWDYVACRTKSPRQPNSNREYSRQMPKAEDEPAAPGLVTQFTDGIKHYYGQTIDTANSYIESIKNVYDETVKAANTYYGIIYDQMYHRFYSQQ